MCQTCRKNSTWYEKSLILSLFGDLANIIKTDVGRLAKFGQTFCPSNGGRTGKAKRLKFDFYFNLMANFHHCSFESGGLFIHLRHVTNILTCFQRFSWGTIWNGTFHYSFTFIDTFIDFVVSWIFLLTSTIRLIKWKFQCIIAYKACLNECIIIIIIKI